MISLRLLRDLKNSDLKDDWRKVLFFLTGDFELIRITSLLPMNFLFITVGESKLDEVSVDKSFRYAVKIVKFICSFPHNSTKDATD